MLSKEQLKWTQKDTEIMERHKKEVESGNIKTVNFLELKKE